jgi:hypothetical protein
LHSGGAQERSSCFWTSGFAGFSSGNGVAKAGTVSWEISVRQKGQASKGSAEIPTLTVFRGWMKTRRQEALGQMKPFSVSVIS